MGLEISHINCKNIDKEKWDCCINEDWEGQAYGLSWYLDIVSPGWEALILLDVQGNYDTVMPLPVRKQFWIAYLQQPFFCQQLGVFGKRATDHEVLEAFLQKLRKLFNYVIDYTFSSRFSGQAQSFPTYAITYYLDLNRPYLEIQKGYTRDRKLNLGRGFKSGLKVIKSRDLEPLLQIFQQHTSHKIYGGVSEDAYEQLRDLYSAFIERDLAKLFYTHDGDGNILTGGLFLIYKNKIIYLFNASTPAGKKSNGNTLILDHVIQDFSNQPYILDFESPAEEFASITQFYASFGSEKQILPQLQYDELPFMLKLGKSIRRKVKLSLKSALG
ncbi:hypothetical protein KI659_16355 [Litoribacter alkaliphilus]|uniref:GNAT family N-acetyltransferase n=1 Tax=Litoribacter ruber TaxID=702568 RepID=A0AAP2G609_9BACT|nr:GNAT family N-acetyltransferase [Litoribacter alkaliphilus]MBS9525591.1 hypothetical protein [Litoribacter alkaliphilus]